MTHRAAHSCSRLTTMVNSRTIKLELCLTVLDVRGLKCPESTREFNGSLIGSKTLWKQLKPMNLQQRSYSMTLDFNLI